MVSTTNTAVTLGTRANPLCSEQPPLGLWAGRSQQRVQWALRPGVRKTPLPPEQGVELGSPESSWREALGSRETGMVSALKYYR